LQIQHIFPTFPPKIQLLGLVVNIYIPTDRMENANLHCSTIDIYTLSHISPSRFFLVQEQPDETSKENWHQLVPAAFDHLTTPSSPPVTNAPEDAAEEEGCHDTAQTSWVSAIVETAARAAKSQTLTVLSAELLRIVNKNGKVWSPTHIPR